MSFESKIFIKFIKYYPFIVLFNIFISSLEKIIFKSNIIDDYICWYVGYSYFSLLPFLIISYRLSFCLYHKIPIFFLYVFLFIQQLIDYMEVENYTFYIFYSISVLILTICIFSLSIYLYHKRKPNKR
jgi:hypothetical protein